MKQILESGFSAQHNMPPALCGTSGGLRALTSEEIEQVGGGFAFVIPPLVVEVATWGGAAFGGAFLGAAGYDAYQYFFGEDDQACSM